MQKVKKLLAAEIQSLFAENSNFFELPKKSYTKFSTKLMEIIYIFRYEKIRDENLVAKQPRIFDQVMLNIFVHFIYIDFDFRKLW